MVLSSNLIQNNINPKPKTDFFLSLTPNQDSEAVNPYPKKGPEFDSHQDSINPYSKKDNGFEMDSYQRQYDA